MVRLRTGIGFWLLFQLALGQDVAVAPTFADDSATQLRTQKEDLVSTQSNLDTIDADKLGPVSKKNANILNALRQAGLMLEGRGDLNTRVDTNRKWKTDLASEISGRLVPAMKSGLDSVQQQLLEQQTAMRQNLSALVGTYWDRINGVAFPNFTATVRSQAAAVIRNISREIRELEVFDSLNTPDLVSNMTDLETYLSGILPDAHKSIAKSKNMIDYIRGQAAYLSDTKLPRLESATNASVMAAIAAAGAAMQQALADSMTAARGQVGAEIAQTSSNYYSNLNRTQTRLLGLMSEDSSLYTYALSDIAVMAASSQDDATRAVAIMASLREKMSTVNERKRILLEQIKPLVAGLGAKIAAARQTVQTAMDSFEANVTAQLASQLTRVNGTIDSLTSDFNTSIQTMYTKLRKDADDKIASVPLAGDTRLAALNVSLERALEETAPRVAGLQVATDVVMTQARASIDTSIALVHEIKHLIFSKIESQFEQFYNSADLRLRDLARNTASINTAFNASTAALASLVKSEEVKFATSVETLMGELRTARNDTFKRFNSSLAAWPDADADVQLQRALAGRQTQLTALQADLTNFEAGLIAFKSGLGKQMKAVNLKLDSFSKDAFVASLGVVRNAAIAALRTRMASNLTAEVAAYSNSSKSINSQFAAAEKAVKDTFTNFEDQLTATAWTPAESADSIVAASEALLDTTRRAKSALTNAIDAVRTEFVSNGISQDAEVNKYISDRLSAMNAMWRTNIDAKLDPAGSVSAMTTILNRINSELAFSEDARLFGSRMRTAKDSLRQLDLAMESGKDRIETALGDMLTDSGREIDKLSLATAKLIDFAPRVVGDDSRVINFKTGQNLLVDKTVNETKGAILDTLKTEFDKTVTAINDYETYVTGTVSAVQSTDAAAGSATSSSVVQLRKTKSALSALMADGKAAAVEERKAAVNIHRLLLENANQLETAITETSTIAKETGENLTLSAVLGQSELRTNLTDFSNWFTQRVVALNAGIGEDETRAQRILRHRERRADHELTVRGKEIRNDLSQVMHALSDTDLFKIAGDVQRVNESIDANAGRVHEGLSSVIARLNTSVAAAESHTTASYSDLVRKYSKALQHALVAVPDAVRAEFSQRDTETRESGAKITDLIDQHEFKTPKAKSEASFRVPIIKDLISETRAFLKKSANEAPRPTDLKQEIRDIQDQLEALKDHHKHFLLQQHDKVKRWIEVKAKSGQHS